MKHRRTSKFVLVGGGEQNEKKKNMLIFCRVKRENMIIFFRVQHVRGHCWK